MRPFVHLHVHSQYSLLDGQASISKLVDKAIADGMPGIALTDHGNMFGVKEFFNYIAKKNGARKEKIKTLKTLIDKLEKEKAMGDYSGYHLILLAKNITGYKNLIKIVSKAYTEGFLGTAGAALTETEIKTLPVGAKLMTLEVGMRFLADYLNGDVYFKTAYPQHNLDRARNQFHLVKEMEEQWDEMMAVVEAYL